MVRHVNQHCLTLLGRKLLLFLLLGWPSISCWAQDNNAFKNFSPKLKQFLVGHPLASTALTNVLSEAFGKRKLGIYYFYCDDESVARAAHYYPNPTAVTIIIRENQLPCDECICLLFEVLNSEGEPRFQQLVGMAKTGTISRVDYATEVLKQEFKAVKKTRDLIATFGLSEKEIAGSDYYDHFIHCPDDFDSFLSYRLKASPNQDPLKGYEQYYDLQKQYYDSLNKKNEASSADGTPTQ
jgi:hypothetical protein